MREIRKQRGSIFQARPAQLVMTLVLTATVGASSAQACTSFSIPRSPSPVTAKSFDWYKSHGMVMVNKRNVRKVASLLSQQDRPVQWVSQRASLTFTQLGREFPYGGINEAGLAVEILQLESSQHPGSQDPRPAINEIQWIQYMLDTARSIPEMVILAGKIRVAPFTAKVHYFACDAKGACGVFEYVDGRLVVSNWTGNILPPHNTAPKAPFPTITNNSYRESMAFLVQHIGFGGTRLIPDGDSSLSRFVRATAFARTYNPSMNPLAFAFDALNKVRNTEVKTQWQIVYDNGARQAFFRTARAPGIKSVRLNLFNTSCLSPVKVFDMNAEGAGPSHGRFVDYSDRANSKLAKQNDFLRAEFISMIAGYPAKGTVCVEKTAPARITRR